MNSLNVTYGILLAIFILNMKMNGTATPIFKTILGGIVLPLLLILILFINGFLSFLIVLAISLTIGQIFAIIVGVKE